MTGCLPERVSEHKLGWLETGRAKFLNGAEVSHKGQTTQTAAMKQGFCVFFTVRGLEDSGCCHSPSPRSTIPRSKINCDHSSVPVTYPGTQKSILIDLTRSSALGLCIKTTNLFLTHIFVCLIKLLFFLTWCNILNSAPNQSSRVISRIALPTALSEVGDQAD